MDIKLLGGNCISINVKKAVLMVDAGEKGVEQDVKKAAVHIATMSDFGPAKPGEAFTIDAPGEYEVAGFSIQGIAAKANMDEEGKRTATIYTVVVAGYKIAIVGHIDPKIDEHLLEQIGMIDIAIVPVGGNGFTMDGAMAAKLIGKLGPKIVIPTHYKMTGVKYEVPQDDLELFTKEIAVASEKLEKLKLKNGAVPDNLTVYELA